VPKNNNVKSSGLVGIAKILLIEIKPIAATIAISILKAFR
jgi:hypothetical protein